MTQQTDRDLKAELDSLDSYEAAPTDFAWPQSAPENSAVKALGVENLIAQEVEETRKGVAQEAEKSFFSNLFDNVVSTVRDYRGPLADDFEKNMPGGLPIPGGIEGLDFIARRTTGVAPTDAITGNVDEMTKGQNRGFYNTMSSFAGGVEQYGKTLGSETITGYAGERKEAFKGKAEKPYFKPRIEGLKDISKETWFSDAVDYAISGVGEGLGSSAPFLTAGAVTGLPGAAAFGYTSSVGELRDELISNGVTDEPTVAKYAYIAAVPHAMLDQLTERGVLKSLTEDARKEATRGIVRLVLNGAVKGAAKEGVTEAAQRVIELGAVAHANGGEAPNAAVVSAIFADVEKGVGSTILESGVKGALPGTVFGVGEVAGQQIAPVQEARARTPNTATDATPVAPADTRAVAPMMEGPAQKGMPGATSEPATFSEPELEAARKAIQDAAQGLPVEVAPEGQPAEEQPQAAPSSEIQGQENAIVPEQTDAVQSDAVTTAPTDEELDIPAVFAEVEDYLAENEIQIDELADEAVREIAQAVYQGEDLGVAVDRALGLEDAAPAVDPDRQRRLDARAAATDSSPLDATQIGTDFRDKAKAKFETMPERDRDTSGETPEQSRARRLENRAGATGSRTIGEGMEFVPTAPDNFTTSVLAAAEKVQVRTGDRVPINLIYDEFAKNDPAKRSLETFKKQLVERGRNRMLELSRADLPERMPGGKVNFDASSTQWDTDFVNYVRLQPGITDDTRQRFAEVLASTTPRSKWAEASGVDPETLNTLIDEAVADGRMEIRFGKPVRKAAARVAPVKPQRPATRTMSRAEEMRVEAIKNSTARTYAQRLLEAQDTAEVDAAITAMQRNKKVSKAVLKEVVRAYGGVRGAPSSTRAAYTMIRNIAASRTASPSVAAPRAPVQTGTAPAAAPAPTPAPQSVEPQERRISIITPDGSMEMTGTIEIVELDSLKAATGAMQPRDRSRKESDNQKRNIAANLDPQQLLPSRVSDTGAPLATSDGTVISGNGRVGALDIVYTDPALADKAAAYRQAIGAPANMKKPVMVVRMSPRATPEELARFADLSNRSRIASLSATERAMRDARAAGMDIMGLYTGGSFTSAENREFFRAFTQLIPPNELNSFSKNGVLTKEGDDRLAASVLAAAYGDPDMLSRMLEDADDDIRSITGAMRDASGAFIRLKAAIRNGLASIKFDISPQVAEVAKRIADLRARNIKPRAFLDQQDAFNQIDPIVEALLVAFYNDNLSRQLSREKITETLVRYADEAAKHQDGGLFEDTTTPREIVATARTRALEGERLAATQQDFFAPSPSTVGRSDAGSGGTGPGQPADGRSANTDRQATAGDAAEDDWPGSAFSLAGIDPNAKFAAEVMAEIAANDDLFQYPVSNGLTLPDIFKDISPDITREGEVELEDADIAAGATSKVLYRNKDGNDLYVSESDEKEVWIDISDFQEGGGGSAVYAAVANYAYNTGRMFIGDPIGLSDIALRRRTDNMLSSALKFGTTEHLKPHPAQLEGDETLGIPPLDWTDGDDAGNIASLINVSLESLAHYVPKIRDATFDFATGTFRNSGGKQIVDGDLREWAATPGTLRAASAGVTTLKRGILFNTLVRSSSGERPGILESALRFQSKLVGGSGLARSFYSLGAVQSDGVGFKEAEFPADVGVSARVLKLKAPQRVHARALFASGLDQSALNAAISTLEKDRVLAPADRAAIAEAYTGEYADPKAPSSAIRKAFAERVHDLSLAELGGFDPAVSGSNLDWRPEARAALSELAARLPEGTGFTVRNFIEIATQTASVRDLGLEMEGGIFTPESAKRHLGINPKSARKIMAISLAYGPDVAMQTFTHEEVHAVREFLTDKEWSVLSKLATRKPKKSEALRLLDIVEQNGRVTPQHAEFMRGNAGDVTYREIYGIDDRYGRLGVAENARVEEVVAHAAADWADGHDFGTRIERVMMKIRDLIEALGNLLRGNGFETVDSVFNSIWSGEVAKRAEEDEKLLMTTVVGDAMYSFAGRYAKTADLNALAKAEQMAAAGASRDQIWQETGWFQGADGKWRFEIDDSAATMSRWHKEGLLGKVLKHKALQEAYPSVAAIPVRQIRGLAAFMSGGGYKPYGSGWFGRWLKPAKIRYSAALEEPVPTLLHEGQHAIQQIEGFARGASDQEYGYPTMSELDTREGREYYDYSQKAVDAYADELMKLDGAPTERPSYQGRPANLVSKLINDGLAWDRMRKSYEKTARDTLNHFAYWKSAGEVEALNVEVRQSMSAEERRAIPPWVTMDIPFEQQFVQKFGRRSPLPPRQERPSGVDVLPPAPLAQTAEDSLSWMRNPASTIDGEVFAADDTPMFSLGDAETGRSMRRDLDQLGYYSGALEAAKALRQEKGTPEQMLAMLKKEGAKEAEIEATGVVRFLERKKSVTKSEIVDYIAQSRLALTESRYSGEEVRKVSYTSDGLGSATYSRVGGEPDAKGAARWSNYALDPSNPTYRETVLHLPVAETLEQYATRKGLTVTPETRGVLEASRGMNELDFRSGHFSEPNIIGHMMTSMVKHEGKPTFLIDQIQSDWGQRLREGGVRDEAKIAGLKSRIKQLDQSRPDFVYENGIMDMAKLQKKYVDPFRKGLISEGLTDTEAETLATVLVRSDSAEGTAGSFQEVDLKREGVPSLRAKIAKMPKLQKAIADFDEIVKPYYAVRSEINLLSAELRTAEAATPGNPLVNTTDQWTNTTLRRAIVQASEAGADFIAIPSGDTVLSYNPGDEFGMNSFYGGKDAKTGAALEGIVPKNLRKLLQKLDRKSPNPIRVEKLETPSSGMKGKGFTLFPLTDLVKESVIEDGQPMFSLAGISPRPEPGANDRKANAIRASQVLAETDLTVFPDAWVGKHPYERADELAQALRAAIPGPSFEVVRSGSSAGDSAYVKTPSGDIRISDHGAHPKAGTLWMGPMEDMSPRKAVGLVAGKMQKTVDTLLAGPAPNKYGSPRPNWMTAEQWAAVYDVNKNLPMFSLAGEYGSGKGGKIKAWHSTPAKFDKFDNRYTDEVGFHFGTKTQAHNRAYIMSGGNLWKYFRNWRDIPVEMDIQNPVRISADPGSFMPTKLAQQLVKDKVAPYELIAQVQDAQLGPNGSPEAAKGIVRDFLLSKGYDAIEYPNTFEDAGGMSYMTLGTGNVRDVNTGEVVYSLAGDQNGTDVAQLNQAIDSLKNALGIQVTQNLFGVTIKAGKRKVRINPRSNILGQTSRSTGGVGVRRSRDIKAIAHEGGHSLELMLGSSLANLKAQHTDALTTPFSPDLPMPKNLRPAGFSGLELDDVEQKALIEAVTTKAALMDMTKQVGTIKAAPRMIGRATYDEEAYRKIENAAGAARANLIRLVGKTRADALVDQIERSTPPDVPTFVQERFSPMGAPKRRTTTAPSGEALSEAFARWFEKYTMSRESAFDMAPGFFDAFEDLLEAEAPSVLEGMHTVQEQYKAWTKRATVEDLSSDVVSVAAKNTWSDIREGKKGFSDKITGWTAEAYTGVIDDLSPVQQIVRRLLTVADRNGVKDDQGRPISLKVAENPYKIARMFRGSYATGYTWIKDGIPNHGEEKVIYPGLQKAMEAIFGQDTYDEPTYRAFGQYLISKRAIAEYDRLAAKKGRLADIGSIIEQGTNAWRVNSTEQAKERDILNRRQAALDRTNVLVTDRTRALNAARTAERKAQERIQELRDDLAEALRAIDDGSDVARATRDRRRRSLQIAERNAKAMRNDVVDLEMELQGLTTDQAMLNAEIEQRTAKVDQRQATLSALESSIALMRREQDATAKRGASRPPTLEAKEWHEEFLAKVAKDKKFAKFEEAAQIVYGFTQGLLTIRYQAGLIPEKLYQELSSRKGWYVPFMRDMSDAPAESVFTGGGVKSWSPFKKFDGSDRAIINPLEILSQESYAAAQHIAMNEAVGALAALAQKAGPGSANIAEMMERTEDLDNNPETFTRIRDIAISMGIDEADATLMAQRMETNFANEDLQAIWSPGSKGPMAEPTLPLWQNGERKHVVLRDPEFAQDALEAMRGMGKEEMGWIAELFGKPARLLQLGVTTHPTFMPRNLVRDVFDAWIKTGALPVITQIRGARELYKKDGEFLRQYTAAGGILGGRNIAALTSKEQQANVMDMDPRKFRLGSALLGTGALGITGAIMGGPLGGIAGATIGFAGSKNGGLLKMVEAIESMTRLGVAAHAYDRAKIHNPGLTEQEAMLEAAFVARDVFDWNRRGSKTLALVRMITFLNAQIQGLDRAARAVSGSGDRGSAVAKQMAAVFRREHDIPLSLDEQRDLGEAYKTWARIGLYTALLLSLYAMYRDDDRYEDIKDGTKATHSWLPGFLGVDVRLPKAFEWAMPANFIEILWDKMEGRDPNVGERWRKSAQEVMVPPGVPQALNLMAGWTMNTDLQSIAPWLFGESADVVNRRIVPDELKKLAPEAQFDAFTSQLSKDVALAMAKAGLPESAIPSPKMIDFTLRTGGYWGQDIQKGYQIIKESAGAPAGPQPRVPDLPVVGGFTGVAARQSKSVEMLYRMMSQQGGDLTSAAATYKNLMDKSGNPAEADAFLNRLEPEARAYAILAYNFPAADKRRHPLERASAMAKVSRDIRKEIVLDRLAPQVKDGRKTVYDFDNKIDLPPPVKTQVTEIFERLAQAESWNGFVVLGRPGWEGKTVIATKPILAELKAAAPDVFELYEQRVEKAKIEDFETIQKDWPKMREELLRNGADANF